MAAQPGLQEFWADLHKSTMDTDGVLELPGITKHTTACSLRLWQLGSFLY